MWCTVWWTVVRGCGHRGGHCSGGCGVAVRGNTRSNYILKVLRYVLKKLSYMMLAREDVQSQWDEPPDHRPPTPDSRPPHSGHSPPLHSLPPSLPYAACRADQSTGDPPCREQGWSPTPPLGFDALLESRVPALWVRRQRDRFGGGGIWPALPDWQSTTTAIVPRILEDRCAT